jgi:hypothetical protein
MQNAKCKMQNAKCKMQNAKCKMQNAKCKMPQHGETEEIQSGTEKTGLNRGCSDLGG